MKRLCDLGECTILHHECDGMVICPGSDSPGSVIKDRDFIPGNTDAAVHHRSFHRYNGMVFSPQKVGSGLLSYVVQLRLPY